MLVQEVKTKEIKQAFENMDRANKFSDEALAELVDYYYDFDEYIELDVIALCCEWSEVTLNEAIESYSVIDNIKVKDDGYLIDNEPVNWRKAFDQCVEQLAEHTIAIAVENMAKKKTLYY